MNLPFAGVSVMESPTEQKRKFSTVFIVVIAVAMLSIGGIVGYWAGHTSTSHSISSLQSQLSTIEEEINILQTRTETATQNQSDVLAKIDFLQNQLSTVRDQINNLQSSYDNNQDINAINSEVNSLQSQLVALQGLLNEVKATANLAYENVTVFLGETALSQLFEQVRDSVVTVQALVREYDVFGRTYLSTVQGSGFVSSYSGQMIIITCNHVVENALDINVTFSNGNTYGASLEGSNPTTDVAVLMAEATQNEYNPLLIVSSSTLKVGDPVIVVGTPYGLEGSMSNGIVSATKRTITVDQTTMTNIIQTTAPLNPGNSGGPLMNYQGYVVGMATAIVQESQGIGLAIPSDTILQNIMQIMS
jgi:S1-C subfamily serine protease